MRGVAMPIYEYRCSACGHELEALQKFSDAPLADCPSCHAATLVKLLSAAGFQLKGSGWYATDFKGSGGKPAPAKTDTAAKSEPGAGSDGGAKGEPKGETPVGAKSEPKSETASSTPAPAAKTGAPSAT
jgi:putative FmdB family regulatory protein